MKCEVCESFSFKKENGVFVCQECGTEYSLEDAKKLLTEIDDSASHKLDKVQKSEENIEKIKLEYDLLCWHNFYEKCHELEKSFYITDDNYGLNVDVASREVVFNYNKYYYESVFPLFNENYIKCNPHLTELHASEMKKRNISNRNRSREIDSANKNFAKKSYLGLLPLIICGVLSLIFYLISAITSQWGLAIFGVVLFVISIPITIILLKKMRLKALLLIEQKKQLPIKEIKEFDNWFYSEVAITDEYKAKQISFYNKYIETAKKDSEEFIEKIPQLKQIKEELIKNVPLPQKYSDEEHVNALLALVLDGRADTLKEAINLFETEAYRNTVINSLNVLNYNIVQLNNNITNLRNDVQNLTNTVYQGFSVLIKQNNYISSQIDSIRFDTRYLMIDSLLS